MLVIAGFDWPQRFAGYVCLNGLGLGSMFMDYDGLRSKPFI